MKKAYIYTGSGSAIDDYNKPKTELANIVLGNQTLQENNWGFFDNKNKQHRTILSQLRTLQWITKSKNNSEIPDIKRLSDFLKSENSPVSKPLKKMTVVELSTIISCFDSIINKKFK
ncbi:hypothetical protein SAMN06265349_101704 [Flavobacterium resistens]|uniref:Uncharacterized protein n=1 Tax=Flavobacterium resistens TaxID=443612 RepID=A0A521B5S3_9FLAO|nr:hypothetical protein [Flavobacterium resistens]MRX70292.1 hypothetical protein [Flavobacterium resistens]SMO42371.1 hypothetical protein SAMN06265349_101704 [Flavobacterium resistens]